MLAAICDAIEARDPASHGHARRVAALAATLGEALGWGESRLDTLRLGGLLHDIGKLAISQHVLTKAGPLAPRELDEIRAHPVVGAKLLEPIPDARFALPCVLFHHERWDGGGYPTGRVAHDIPVEARVLAVADAFDAMTSTRPYRRALETHEALLEITRCAGTQFDPGLALLFVDLWHDEVAVAASA